MKYSEEKSVTLPLKQNYVDGLNRMLADRQKHAAEIRKEYSRDIFRDPERYREDLRSMLGWPLTQPRPAEPPVVAVEELSREEGYTIYRMQVQILEDVTMTGLFFRQDGTEKRPLVLVQHGGGGTPELISGVYGDTANYNDMLHRVLKEGVHVFAPQLLLWRADEFMDSNRSSLDAWLKRVGSSISAVEIYGLSRILDYFETQDYVSTFGMVGVSYGGFYTLYTTAVDTRIRSAISCAYFNQRDVYGWSDWTWHCSAEKFDDAEVACLAYPRRLCVQVANKDYLFDCPPAEASAQRVRQLAKDVGTDWFDFILFDGSHEFYKDDAPIRRMVQDLLR